MSIPYNLPNVNRYYKETFSDNNNDNNVNNNNVNNNNVNNDNNNNSNNNVKVNENTFIAKGRTLTRKCPHQGCMLNYNDNRKEFICPCHHSKFNLDGNCISGPACPSNIRV